MAHNMGHPKEHVSCPECDAEPPAWARKRQLPQVGQTYECDQCGHEVHVYETGETKGHERRRTFRPVTHSMVVSLQFFDEVGDWPDSALEDLFKQGLERAEAIDYYVVEEKGLSQSEWGRRTDRLQSSVSENVSKAKGKLDG